MIATTVIGVLATVIAVLAIGGAARRQTFIARGGRPRRWARWAMPAPVLRRRRAPVSDREMATWCEHAARAVRAGASVPVAITDACAAAPGPRAALAPASDGLRRGLSMSAALARVVVDPSHPEAAVVAVLRACTEIGGPAAPALERVATVLHGRADAAAERWSHSAQARLSARVLTVLPAGVGALLVAAEPSIRTAAVSPAGIACIAGGATLNAGGWCWMRHLIASAR